MRNGKPSPSDLHRHVARGDIENEQRNATVLDNEAPLCGGGRAGSIHPFPVLQLLEEESNRGLNGLFVLRKTKVDDELFESFDVTGAVEMVF
jgi:hypothetical protein